MISQFRRIEPIIRTREDAEEAQRRAICLQFGFYEPGHWSRFDVWDISYTADGAEIALYADTDQLPGILSRISPVTFTLMGSRNAGRLDWFDVHKMITLFQIPDGSHWEVLNDGISFRWSRPQ